MLNLKFNVSQKFSLTPRLYYANCILQLSSLELRDRVEQEWNENPFLENASDEHEGEDWIEQDYVGSGTNVGARSSSMDVLVKYVPKEESLLEHLMQQVRVMPELSKQDIQTCEILISSLDEHGYLRESAEEIALSSGCFPQQVEKAMLIVRSLDPAGIGASDWKEALMMQLVREYTNHPMRKLAMSLLTKDVWRLKKRHYKQLASIYKCPRASICAAVELIQQLEPIPSRMFASGKIVQVICPDIIVKRKNDSFIIQFDKRLFPSFKISTQTVSCLKNRELSSATFMKNKLNEAKLLVFSLKKREQTMRKVINMLLLTQREFFLKGPDCLKPLTLNDIAEQIDMHASTVSRVVRNKYILTDWGLFDLKYFFSCSVHAKDGVIATQKIKDRIKKIILQELPFHHGSDREIMEKLKLEGINIARRTISKYRKQMKIDSSVWR